MIRHARVALALGFLVTLPWANSGRVAAQDRPAPQPGRFDSFGRWDAGAPAAGTLPAPGRQPRRWKLYFPPDWRHPAIVRPPVKVFLDPPYGWEDPFGRWPGPEPQPEYQQAPEPEPPVDTPSVTPPAITRPKVLELNPNTGRLEDRDLQPVEPEPGSALGEEPDPPPATQRPRPAAASPFRGLHRWDTPAS